MLMRTVTQEEIRDGLGRLRGTMTNGTTTNANAAAHVNIYHMSEAAVSTEIARIFRSARPQTAEVYDLADNGVFGENWIIRWLLFHLSGDTR